jgi:hypothetical protein
MTKKFAVYKGLQKPLIFKGFKGRFIYWGLGCLLAGIVSGAFTMALINMYLGVLVLVLVIAGGLLYTAAKQKEGLYAKGRDAVTYIHPPKLHKIIRHGKKN